MTSRVVIGVAVAMMLAAFMVTSMAIIMTDSALAQGPPRILINLTGNEEVPPVQTEATGVAEFIPMGEDSIAYTVNVTDIEGVTAGHIHVRYQI